MGKYRNLIFYVATIGGFSALIYWIATIGKGLETGKEVIKVTSEKSQWVEFLDSFSHNIQHPLALLLAQIVTIVIVARLFGWICVKIGQPSVIGEMIAGILLGPSFIGMYFPEFSAALFPVQSLGNLQFLSQVGLILFMYIVGMEVDLKVLRTQAHDAVVISHASIIFPFALGFGLAYFIYSSFAPAGVEFLSFSLFIGIAMSITAFPVLARIVQERGIQKTKLGTIVITCAAADDITAWCILAAVIAIVKAGSLTSSLFVIVLAIAYVLLMIKGVRPFLKRIGELYPTKETLSKPIIAIFLLVLILSSYLTEIIGIHALFGAFMAGAIMPDKIKFRDIFIEKVEDVAMILFLPLFFVFTGLRTEIGLINDIELWKLTGWIIVVAVAGKFLGSAVAAKFVGQNWKDSLTIGALMNTRGLMELVVLNIGYDLGVLSPEMFSMMVIMALVTTFMTGPALDLINWAFKSKKEKILPVVEMGPDCDYKVLLSFTNPQKGRSLLKLANGFVSKSKDKQAITAMHITSSDQIHGYISDEREEETLQPIVEEAQALNQRVITLSKASSNINSDIIEISEQGNFDLLLTGIQHSIYKGTLLGNILGFTTSIIDPERLVNKLIGKESFLNKEVFGEQLQTLIDKMDRPIGILIDNDLQNMNKVCIPIFSDQDISLLRYGKMLARNAQSKITIIDVSGRHESIIKQKMNALSAFEANNINVYTYNDINEELMADYSLVIVSIESWKQLVEEKSKWLTSIPSTLIITAPKKVIDTEPMLPEPAL
jgi:Kef-type K+ transport system membrane component KefB